MRRELGNLVTSSETGLAEAELLAAAAAGDAAAFTALYRAHQARLYRFALFMGATTETAEDVVQDVFLTVLRAGLRYDPGRATLGTYLCAIARNLLRDRVREGAPETALDTLGNEPPGEAGELWRGLDQRQRLEALQQSLASLPIVYREVVVLCDLQEMNYTEAAAVLECAPGTIASRRHRAHQLLQRKLRERHGEEGRQR